MEIICNQNELNNAIQLVSKAVASRPTHPILANILLTADEGTNKISVTGFDLNLGIQTSFDGTVKNSGAITIPSKLLSEIVNKLPNETPVSLELDENSDNILIKSDRGSFNLKGIPSDEYPNLPFVESGTSLNIDPSSFLKALKSTIFASSNDDSKQLLTGVNFTFKQNYLESASTDGHRLAVALIGNEEQLENKDKLILDTKNEAYQVQSTLTMVESNGSVIDNKIESIEKIIKKIREKTDTMNANNREIVSLNQSNEELKRYLESEVAADLTGARNDLQQMNVDKESLFEEKLKVNEQYSYNNVIAEMLRDTGIKTKIIKQYLPVINKLVNQYLQVLDFFVSFNLDENFNETIRSRHRDDFTYDSFSEGEKQRIDLSLLFTWRQIAKMKNSVATNLLILDETFDSSLDHDGIENLLKILNTLDNDTNTFIISHKGDILDGKFQSKIEFIKERNFSKIKA